MPFLIPLIPVLTGAITGLVAELAIGAAVVGGLGYVAKDQDLMKVGGLLGIASLGFGLAGEAGAGAAAGSDSTMDALSAAESDVSASAASDAANVTGAAASEAAGVSGNVEGAVAGIQNPDFIDYTPYGNGLAGNATNVPMAASGEGSSFNIIDNPAGEIGSGQAPVDAASGDGAVEQLSELESEIHKPYEINGVPKDPADTVFDGWMSKWNSLGDKEKAAWLQLGGSALSGLAPDQRAEAYKKQLEFEMMKYRERLKNMNNVGYINLSMNPNQAPKPY